MQGAKKCQYKDVDITVAMLKSLATCNYPAETFRDFGMIIFDEVHTLPARTYSAAVTTVLLYWQPEQVTNTLNCNISKQFSMLDGHKIFQ